MNKTQQLHIAKLISYLSHEYKNEFSGHDWQHIFRVYKMARELCKGQDVREYIVAVAALCHDIDDYKVHVHDEQSYTKTMHVLTDCGVSQKDQVEIIACIETVSFRGVGVPTIPTSLEGKIVQDADRLDAIGAIGIARCFAYGASHGIAIYDPEQMPRVHTTFASYKTNSTSLNHFQEKLVHIKDRLHTIKAKEIAKQRHAFVEQFYQEFLDEINGIK